MNKNTHLSILVCNLFFAILSVNCLYGQTNILTTSIVSGKIVGKQGTIVVKNIMAEEDLQSPSLHTSAAIDSIGNFYMIVPVAHEGYYAIGSNVVFLVPGGKLKANLTYRKPEVAAYIGTYSSYNTFLRNVPNPKGGSYLNSGDSIKSTIETTIASIMNSAEKMRGKLAKTKDIPTKFRRLEETRIVADTYYSVYCLYGYFPVIHKLKDKDKENFYTEYKQKTDSLLVSLGSGLLDSKYLDLKVYRDLFWSLKQKFPKLENLPESKAWVDALVLNEQILNADNDLKLDSLGISISEIKNKYYQKLLQISLKEKYDFKEGDIAINFFMEDTAGNRIDLAAFKNKVIYIDFWATWCRPCIALFPFLQELKNQLKGEEQIKFLTISLDEDSSKWQSFLRTSMFLDDQYLANKTALSMYKIESLPRAILIDRNFKIVSMYADEPTEENLYEQIVNLLK